MIPYPLPIHGLDKATPEALVPRRYLYDPVVPIQTKVHVEKKFVNTYSKGY